MILRLLFDAPQRETEPAEAEDAAGRIEPGHSHPQIAARPKSAIASATLPAQQ
jgi:hypothetical protein